MQFNSSLFDLLPKIWQVPFRPCFLLLTFCFCWHLKAEEKSSGECSSQYREASSTLDLGARRQAHRNVRKRVKEVLGPLYYQPSGLRITSVPCLLQSGCSFEAIWNVIQMADETVLGDAMNYAVTFSHEFAHLQLFSQDSRLLQTQNLGRPLRRNFLNMGRALHRTKESLASGGLPGNREEGEQRCRQLIACMEEESTRFLDFYLQEAGDLGFFTVNDLRLLPLNLAFSEMFSDLVTSAVFRDGDAIVKTMPDLNLASDASRQNEATVKMPNFGYHRPIFVEDPHTVLEHARRHIWQKYLRGESDQRAQQVFAALIKSRESWLSNAKLGFFLARPGPLGKELDPLKYPWIVDLSELNMLMIDSFETALSRQ